MGSEMCIRDRSSVESKAKLYNLSNIQTVWADLEVYGGARSIKDQSIDIVLLIQLLFQVRNRQNVFKEISRIIKSDGLLAVIEWKKNKLGFGPKETDCLAKEEVVSMAKTFTFKFKEEIKAGPYHYGLIFERA